MGADLYIKSISDRLRDQKRKAFEDAVVRRDAATDPAEKRKAQEEVEAAYDAMYADGYFRDSYNNSSVAWVLGFSWWNDIVPLLDEEGNLPVDKFDAFKGFVSRHQPTLKPGVDYGESDAEALAYFEKKQQALLNFIEQARALNEPIYCSL